MKKLFFFLFAAAIVVTASCNKDNPSTPVGPEMVDLGLSVKWANCNLGATKPEEYGRYFAWGDVVGQTWNGTKWSGDGFYTSPVHQLDANDNLKPECDAAHVLLGGNWRMPTRIECQELIENCTGTWTSDYNGTGKCGMTFTSKKSGFEGKSIFIPAAGIGGENIILVQDLGCQCWSSTLYDAIDEEASSFQLSEYVCKMDDLVYSAGCSIRPVCK